MKLYIDLESLQLIEGPGFRNPVSTLRFKRGDSASLEVVFLAGGLTPVTIGDPETLHLDFGVKPRNRYDVGYLVHADVWTKPDQGEESPIYHCSPSFNTVELDSAMLVGTSTGAELSEIVLMGEIAWRTGAAEPTSTRTFIVVVENDVNRGTEGIPTSAEPPYPAPSNLVTTADLEAIPNATPENRGYLSPQDKLKLDRLSGTEFSTLPALNRCEPAYRPYLSNGQTTGAQVSLSSNNFLLVPFFIPRPTLDDGTKYLRLTSMGFRAGGSGLAAGSQVNLGIYQCRQGLPTEVLTSRLVTLATGLAPNAVHETQLNVPLLFPEPGPYWFAIMNSGASSIDLASAEPWTPLFGDLVGTGLDITGSPPRALSGASANSGFPFSMDGRLLEMRSTTASQSTLRVRVSAPIFYAAYDIVTA